MILLYILLLFAVLFLFIVGIEHITRMGIKQTFIKSILSFILLILWCGVILLALIFILDKVSYFILQ